uniref:Ribosomal protein S7 n=1 Tax=Gloeochaete wittrockiana TaxID=38269 RepID=A0A3G1IW39_9EUKA|nr:ribosomal protein S7 [Gloeochaete wittrockiana]ASQ40260.1 ribosomal protein S7 [Gloeochaete wittrockiana]
MSRGNKLKKISLSVDPLYKSGLVNLLICHLTKNGKKSIARRFIYQTLKIIEQRKNIDSLKVLEQAIKNTTPLMEVKARRIGGSTYQVPLEVRTTRGISLAIRWIIRFSSLRTGKSMAIKLANELIDAANETGASIKKREEVHRMAEANKAFTHYHY